MRGQFIKRYLGIEEAGAVTLPHFQKFLSQEIEENQNLEYKPRGIIVDKSDAILKPTPSNPIAGFTALAKTVSGFANADGGLLVLGVKEKNEIHKGQIVKIRPGIISAIPPTVSREMIENQLRSLIQYPIDDILIVPIRMSAEEVASVFLIDVPQSTKAPHRVGENYYFQRYNFSTLPMQHFQIADLFGKRSAPELVVRIGEPTITIPPERVANFDFFLLNTGRAAARHVLVVCSMSSGNYKFSNCSSSWELKSGGSECKWIDNVGVTYPDVLAKIGQLGIIPLTNESPCIAKFECRICAENMPRKTFEVEVKLPIGI